MLIIYIEEIDKKKRIDFFDFFYKVLGLFWDKNMFSILYMFSVISV